MKFNALTATFKGQVLRNWALLAITPSVISLIALINSTGFFQRVEWFAYDTWFHLRPIELRDSKTVVVTIDDNDLSLLNEWPISDQSLADLLLKIQRQNPRIIGLDIYRNLAVEPGEEKLVQVFQSMPNLIGIQKLFGLRTVPPPKLLADQDQVAVADLIEDSDFKVRRGLISAQDQDGQIHLGLGAQVAMKYLAEDGISLAQDGTHNHLTLGKAIFRPFRHNDGGYINADDAGYQILLNFRGWEQSFEQVSLTDVLANNVEPDLFRDRIVFIGLTAQSTYDFFAIPYHHNAETGAIRIPGVFIHANIASQIVYGALDGRPFINTVPDSLEWAWALGWSLISVVLSRKASQAGQTFGLWLTYGIILLTISLSGIVQLGLSYVLFLHGWWLPIIPSSLGILASGMVSFGIHSQRLHQLAYKDGLTQIANRRYFDQVLTRHIQLKGYLSVILCDVDHFKLYNDTYGHQAGDACLQAVAKGIQNAVRRSDLVARYGGEEFVVMLPHASKSVAIKVAERVVYQVRALKLPHRSSKASRYVTLSCGVTTMMVNSELLDNNNWSAESLLISADKALYRAKEEGRNRAVSHSDNDADDNSHIEVETDDKNCIEV